ncbi:hypothetical protein TNCV_3019181 [Trichonephila clavipes]|nr:hypothetical protein TNCV_3019181 [Trichonephila clavipes]
MFLHIPKLTFRQYNAHPYVVYFFEVFLRAFPTLLCPARLLELSAIDNVCTLMRKHLTYLDRANLIRQLETEWQNILLEDIHQFRELNTGAVASGQEVS